MTSEQGTLDWHRERLGIPTSSSINDLLGKLKKDKEGKYIVPDLSAKTALSYIYQKAAERCLRPELIYDDELFEAYIRDNNFTSRAMQHGIDNEPYARMRYAKKTGFIVEETGLQKYYIGKGKDKKILFGDSPDGLINNREEREAGCLEIKCPNSSTHLEYCEMTQGEDLLEVEQKYYIQCQCHIIANKADWCDFVSYDPRVRRELHIIRVYPDQLVIDLIIEVLIKTNEKIDNIIKGIL